MMQHPSYMRGGKLEPPPKLISNEEIMTSIMDLK
jgi:hypothetical protein